MKKLLPLFFCVAWLSLLPSAPAAVGEKVTFPSFVGGHVYGKKISRDDLRGKVVFFEYWGINCPPCRMSMPHLVELQRKYGSKGLVVIGSHVQFMSPQVKEFLAENKVNFPIYEHKSLPEAPCPGGIPYSVLIGVDGRVVAEGAPSQLYSKVEGELSKVTGGYPILEGVELGKYRSLERTLVSNGSNIEAKVESLREAAQSGDAEASAICEAYDAWLTREKERVSRLCESDPFLAMRAVAGLKKAVPSVTEFDGQVQSFKSNPVYMKLDAVRKKLNGQKKRNEQGKRVSARVLRGLRKSLAEIRTSDAEGVEELCDSLEADISTLEEDSASAAQEKKGRRARQHSSED